MLHSRAPAGASGRGSHLHGLLLILGLALMFHLLLSDLFAALAPGTVPATGALAARLSPLTQGAAMDGFGAWSPSGREIAFMRDGQILVSDPAGRRVRPLTSQPAAWDAGPAWRPDGKALAFVRLSTRDDQAQVMELSVGAALSGADGPPAPRELAREAGPVGYLAWSPAGDALYYTTADRIVRIDTATGRREQVFQAPRGWDLLSGGLAVARDGRSLIFGGGPRLESGVEYDLYRIPALGGEPLRLTTQGGIMPSLHPSGQLVAYRNPRTETGIYLFNLATRASERLLPDDPKAMYFHPSFSPDGRRLLVSRLLLTARQGRGGFTSNLFVYSLEGKGGGP